MTRGGTRWQYDMSEEEIKAPTVIPAGMIFTVSTGEYSDYSVCGVFKATAAIDTSALLEEWLTQHPEQREAYKFNERNFLAWAFRKGLFEPVRSMEWHLSDYSDVENMLLSDEAKWSSTEMADE